MSTTTKNIIKECGVCGASVTLSPVGRFVYNADRRLRACREGDDVYAWVDIHGEHNGCSSNPHMAHSVKGLITEVRRGDLVVGRTRKG